MAAAPNSRTDDPGDAGSIEASGLLSPTEELPVLVREAGAQRLRAEETAVNLPARVEEFRVMLREARARGLTPDEQEDLDELTRAMRRLLNELDPEQEAAAT